MAKCWGDCNKHEIDCWNCNFGDLKMYNSMSDAEVDVVKAKINELLDLEYLEVHRSLIHGDSRSECDNGGCEVLFEKYLTIGIVCIFTICLIYCVLY